MAESFIYDNDKYLDSKGIVHNKRKLNEILDNKIVIGLNANSSFEVETAWADKKVTLDTLKEKFGDKLSFKNNSIVIGKEISRVEISATALVRGINGSMLIKTYKNNELITSGYYTASNTSAYGTITLVPYPIEVKEGDEISLDYTASTPGVMWIAGASFTYLIVEAF